MDYDFGYIYRIIHGQYNAQVIIPINRRDAYAPPEGLDWDCTPLCSMGYRMSYWGYDYGSIKFRCPNMTVKIDCPMDTNWCSSGNYGAVVEYTGAAKPQFRKNGNRLSGTGNHC